MKTITLLTRVTVAAIAVSAVAFALDLFAVGAFAIAASSLLALIAARDYAHPVRRWQPSIRAGRNTRATRGAQSYRLAA